MKCLFSLAFLVVLNLSVVQAAQDSSFHFWRLSPNGRAAYQKLMSVEVFSIGGVGYAGVPSEGELALNDLLDEAEAVNALKSLVREASFEGGMYGLFGLSLTNVAEFNRAIEVYKSREPAERTLKELFKGIKVSRNQIATMSGCILSTQDQGKVIENIKSGRFEKMRSPKR